MIVYNYTTSIIIYIITLKWLPAIASDEDYYHKPKEGMIHV